jgi:hypothetical protein
MEAASAIATPVEASATVAASSVEAAPAAAVETSAASPTVTAAMLGGSRDGQTDEYEGSDAREK